MKILFFSNLFPDAGNPNRGIYNARLVKHLGEHDEVRVVSPRPTPGLAPFWSPKSYSARVEDRDYFPLFPPAAYLPKIGDRWNHRLMACSLRKRLKQLRTEFPFEVVLASWLFPDACALAELAREMGFRFVAVAQGSDAHQYLKVAERRKIIVRSLAKSTAVITRSQELARLLANAGVNQQKLHTIYNGVETEIFSLGDKAAARTVLGLAKEENVLLYVGNFLPIKNPLLLIKALAVLKQKLPEKKFRLVMLGDGALLAEIKHLAANKGLADMMTLPGRKTPTEVAEFMRAADLLCVPSNNEGVPNVILEAFACGLRSVATRVGGIPEILTEPHLGQLTEAGDAVQFAEAVASLITETPQTSRVVSHASRFSWKATAAAYRNLLNP